MEKDYQNNMVVSSHIRDVGPHSHEWKNIHTDSRGDVYQECSLCGTRRSRGPSPGLVPVYQAWIAGGEAEFPEPEPKAKAKAKAAKENNGNDQPTASAVRVMSKADLIEYGEDLGLEFDEGATRPEMIEAILAKR